MTPPSLRLLVACLPAVFCAVALHGQDDTLPDLDSLDPENFAIESDLLPYHSAGWFPRPHPGATLQVMMEGTDVWDQASAIRSRAFAPSAFPFSHRNPFGDTDERTTMLPFSDEEDEYPATGLTSITALFTLNLPLPVVLNLEAGVLLPDGLLFSSDRTRSFLDIDGSQRNFHEVTVVYLEETLLKGGIGISIPFYGAFLAQEEMSIASYYYVRGGVVAHYALSSQMTQYAQIADAKDRLRYGNGTDTVVVQSRGPMRELESLRYGVSIGVGWAFSTQFFAFTVEPYVTLPLTSVLKDADWKQYYGGARLSLGYQWGNGK